MSLHTQLPGNDAEALPAVLGGWTERYNTNRARMLSEKWSPTSKVRLFYDVFRVIIICPVHQIEDGAKQKA